jgi:hypothetical protein
MGNLRHELSYLSMLSCLSISLAFDSLWPSIMKMGLTLLLHNTWLSFVNVVY